MKLSLVLVNVLFSGCIVIPTYQEKISLKPTRQNKQELSFNNVLLVGTGSVGSRVFLENLSTEMIRLFMGRGIQSEFAFVGKIPNTTGLRLDSLIDDKYDACLVFMAANSSYLDMTKEKFHAIGPAGYATSYGNQFSETHTLTLYQDNKNLQANWQGNLKVDFDIANGRKYKKIAKLVFNEISKNLVLAD